MKDDEILHVGSSFEMTEFIGNDLLIGVPFDAPEDFKRRIWAAANSYLYGNKSTDYFLRQYGEHWNFERPSRGRRRMANFLRLCAIEAESIHFGIVNGKDRTGCCVGLMAAEFTLGRIITTYKSVAFNLVQGYVFESAALMRLILEQLAWAYAIRRSEDGSFFEVSSTKCITGLKTIYPTAGKLYSQLSDYTHINPKLHPQFLDTSEDVVAICYRQHELCARFAVKFGELVDLFRVVLEATSFDYIDKPLAWIRNEQGELEIVSGRPFIDNIQNYSGLLDDEA